MRAILYRFDCPSPLTIGEYVLDLLEPSQRTALASHVLECNHCAEELRETRGFMATELVVQRPGPVQQLRRVFATLFEPAVQAYSMARGSDPSGGAEYRAGAVKIVIGAVRGKRRGTVAVDGLILHDFYAAETLADRQVMLTPAAQLDAYVTRTDDLGGFAFEDVAEGTYSLEVTLSEEVVVVEDVHVSS